MKLLESKNIGRGLSLTAGVTLAYLINKVQKERMPSDFIGYSLKTSACFLLGQRAVEKEDEFLVKALLGYWGYETLRLTPIGKPPKADVVQQSKDHSQIAGYFPTQDNSTPHNHSETIQNPSGSLGGISGLMTPENMQMAGVALKGLASVFSGFMGDKE